MNAIGLVTLWPATHAVKRPLLPVKRPGQRVKATGSLIEAQILKIHRFRPTNRGKNTLGLAIKESPTRPKPHRLVIGRQVLL